MVETFDAEQWVLRMGKELERVASDADPRFLPRNAPPPWGATEEQIREHEKRQYRDLARGGETRGDSGEAVRRVVAEAQGRSSGRQVGVA